jgi:polyisoprenyl-teichoic acid--peptidoglycan teichoic acid transferase
MINYKTIVDVISKIIAIVLTIIFLLSFGLLFYLNALPLKYSLPTFLVLSAFLFYLVILLFEKKVKIIYKVIMNFISIIIILLVSYLFVLTLNTINFFDKLKIEKQVEVYYLVSLKTSIYDTVDSIENTEVGIFNNNKESAELALYKLNEKILFIHRKSDDLFELKTSLTNNEISSIFIEKSFIEFLKEEDEEFSSLIRIIYEVTVDSNTQITSTKVYPTKESFNVYITGIDTYGDLSNVSRSDVNIIMTVNPNTQEILLTTIPRDYYVQLSGTTGIRDKLTHAGVYGVGTSIGTIEDLLDIDIHYYIRVNFNSVIQVVDDLGGIEVNSKYSFTSGDGFSFKKGPIFLNSEQALVFVRERKTIPGGDRGRGENQQAVLTAIIDKALNPSILVKYNTLIRNLSDAFETNIDSNTIISLVRMQLYKGENWNIESISLDGTDSLEYTYSYRAKPLYVMVPDQATIDNAKLKINETLNKENL